MKQKFFLAVILAAFAFTSCKKDKNDNDGGNNNVTRLIKKMTKTENGQTHAYTFTYDANKKLTGFTRDDNNEFVKFTYENGNLVKVEDFEEGFRNIYTYSYTNNVPVSGTFKSYELTAGEPDAIIEDDELTYTVANGLVTKIGLYFKDYDEALNMDLSYTNGNLTKIEADASSAYAYKATFEFGNKKSPFPQVSTYVLDQAGFSLFFVAKNELKKSFYDFPGTQLDYQINTTYTYDNAGYPLTSDDGETKIVYEYQ